MSSQFLNQRTDVNGRFSSLKQNIESLEQRCDELTKQMDDMAYNLESEKHKNERLREISHETPAPVKTSNVFGNSRHTSSASEPETEEVSSSNLFNCGHRNYICIQIRLQHPQIRQSHSPTADKIRRRNFRS